MNSKRWLTTVLLLLCSLGAVADAQTTNSFRLPDNLPQLRSKLQQHLDQSRISAKFPGAEVGFTWVDETPNGPQYYSGSVVSGVADIERNIALKDSDRLLAGSIGKTFVAVAALMLVEQGKLNLDDKISTWLGHEPWFAQLPNSSEVTLRMLLNHSSGIPNHLDAISFEKVMFKSAARDINYAELIGYILNKKPLFAAGHGFSYTDTNYILIGMIIEKVSGKTMYALIDDLILKPHKLERTIPSNALMLPDVVNGYMRGKPIVVNGKFTVNPQWEWAGGGYASTAEDLSRWAALLYGGSVLKPNSFDQMIHSTTSGEGAAYGLGVMITESRWGKSYGHDGEFPGYLADMRYYPQFKLAVAVMVNADESPTVLRFASAAVDDFAGDIISELVGRKISAEDQQQLRKIAEGWLNLIDTGRFAESWNRLSIKLQAKYTKETWPKALKPLLSQAGKVKKREFKSVYSTSEDDLVLVDFESTFDKGDASRETVTFGREDGQWKVRGYSIH